MTDDQIKHMANRFLGWKLPADFHPDNGISYQRPNYHPSVDATPDGTNLFTAAQAEVMVQYMVEDVPHPEGWTPQEIEDALTDAIGDSFEMDWQARDGAKAVTRMLSDCNLHIAPRYNLRPHPTLTDAEIVEMLAPLAKIMPIRFQPGADYAEVFFSDGVAHSTRAMTMNPKDWLDVADCLTTLRTAGLIGDGR